MKYIQSSNIEFLMQTKDWLKLLSTNNTSKFCKIIFELTNLLNLENFNSKYLLSFLIL